MGVTRGSHANSSFSLDQGRVGGPTRCLMGVQGVRTCLQLDAAKNLPQRITDLTPLTRTRRNTPDRGTRRNNGNFHDTNLEPKGLSSERGH